MKAYSYDENGFYNGEIECQESPLEPGVFLVPANSTTSEIPSPSGDLVPRFLNGEWQLQLPFSFFAMKNDHGIPLYKLVDGSVVSRTDSEIAADEKQYTDDHFSYNTLVGGLLEDLGYAKVKTLGAEASLLRDFTAWKNWPMIKTILDDFQTDGIISSDDKAKIYDRFLEQGIDLTTV